jgi:hypothetical protein
LTATWLDSFDEEAQREEAELMVSSSASGETGNGGDKRRPELGFGRAQGRGKQREGESSQRGSERGMARGLYPLVQRSGGGGHLLAGIDGGQLATEQFAERRKTTGRCWAGPLVGFGRERRGGRLGWNRPKARKVLSFFSKIFFYFLFSQNPL